MALASLVSVANPENGYDIFILHEQLKASEKKTVLDAVAGLGNFSIRFVQMQDYLDGNLKKILKMSPWLPQISFATYYRFLIGRIFGLYDKIIYLDCDLILAADPAGLLEIDLGEAWLGAVRDIRENIAIKNNLLVVDCRFGDYVKNQLGLAEPSRYFQAGVLVFNVRLFKEDGVEQALFAKAAELRDPPLMDQDILNSVCQGRVCYLPVRWNVQWQILFEFPDYHKELPMAFFHAYEKALKNPAIIHYASPVKPWNSVSKPLASIWWKHARHASSYEVLVARLAGMMATQMVRQNSIPWRIAKKFLPTRVRRLLWFLLRKVGII